MAGESQSLSTTSNPTTSSPIPTTSSATMTEVNEGTVHAADRAPTTQATSRPRRNFQIPAVALGQEHFLSRSLAANLASCLLKHILFLKSQIPFPVAQLERMSRSATLSQSSVAKGGALANRGVQKRTVLLEAARTLNSHLESTFSALSTVMAMRARRAPPHMIHESNGSKSEGRDAAQSSRGRVVMQLVLGGIVSVPKARVVLVLDGLELKVRRERENVPETTSVRNEDDVRSSFEEPVSNLHDKHSTSGEDELEPSAPDDDESASPPPNSSSGDEEEDESSGEASLSNPNTNEEPPSGDVLSASPPTLTTLGSRSNPFSASRGLSENDPSLFKPAQNTTPPRSNTSFTIFCDPPADTPTIGRTPLAPLPALVQPANGTSLGFRDPRPSITDGPLKSKTTGMENALVSPRLSTHSKTAALLHQGDAAALAAERQLSRALADACAEPSCGLPGELAPTQTHVLLRAPRSFQHPSWVPRQRETSGLDKAMATFLADSGIDTPAPPVDDNEEQSGEGEHGGTKTIKPKKTHGVPVDGVWIGARGDEFLSEVTDGANVEDQSVEEEDEMIWWEWDGKIVGFSEW